MKSLPRLRVVPVLPGLIFALALVAITLRVAAADPAPAEPTPAKSDRKPPAKDVNLDQKNRGFFDRLGNAFKEQWNSPAFTPPDPKAPPPLRRGQPTPFDSPPFPNAEWQIGGTPIIGDPNILPPGPLMQAFYDGPNGDAIKNSRIQLYGWENFSGNLSTSTSRDRSLVMCVTSAVSNATSAPCPMATPTVASARAGVSFTPSPTITTLFPS